MLNGDKNDNNFCVPRKWSVQKFEKMQKIARLELLCQKLPIMSNKPKVPCMNSDLEVIAVAKK